MLLARAFRDGLPELGHPNTPETSYARIRSAQVADCPLTTFDVKLCVMSLSCRSYFVTSGTSATTLGVGSPITSPIRTAAAGHV